MADVTKAIACPLCWKSNCGKKEGYGCIGNGSWSLHQCRDCGTAFIVPVPSARELEPYYDSQYYGKGEKKFIGPAEQLSRFFRHLRARMIHNLSPRGRILDVGCGRGIMLKALKRWGHRVEGVELDSIAMTRATRNIGQRIYHSLHQLESGETPERFDVISFWHSLEHLPEPHRALEAADRILNPHGFLIIAAPNFACIQARLSGKNWLHLDLPRHLTQYDMNRLAEYLLNMGYRMIKHDHFSQEYNPIDTLCHLYQVLGFDPLFPYRLLGGIDVTEDLTWKSVLQINLGLMLMPICALSAFLLSNAFSLLGSGSTTTLILQKKADSCKGRQGQGPVFQ